MLSSKLRAHSPTRRTVVIAIAVPLLAAPLACTAILGDFTVSASGPNDGGNGGADVTNDGPSDTTHFDDVVQIAAGRDHTCALRSTGEVFCWGDNSLGQLGTSTGTSSSTPVHVANLKAIRAIAAGDNHTCALDGNITSGGKAYCWGSNSKGQLGSASAGDHTAIPQTLAAPTNFVGVTAGPDYTCAYDSGGIVSCWGSNLVAQLGIAHDSTSHTDPVTTPIKSGAQEMSAGTEVACMIASGSPSASFECWGTANSGEIPDTDGGPEFAPTLFSIGSSAGAAHIATGVAHACATDTSGAAYCWGSNDYGESAKSGSTGADVIVPPNLVPNVSGVAAIGAGEHYSCALTVAQYGMSCWGSNNYGALGNGQPTTSGGPQAAPSPVAGLSGVGVISVGFRHACAIVKPAPTPGQPDTASGAAWCWGDDSKGQLGDGTSGNQKSSPVQVLKPAS